MDVMVPTDERHFLRTAKSCGPGAPMQALSLREMLRERRWQSSRFTGEITYKPQNHRAGKAGVYPPVPVVNALFAQFFARGPRVHAATRSSLRPLISEGDKSIQNSGATGRENDAGFVGTLPRHKLPVVSA